MMSKPSCRRPRGASTPAARRKAVLESGDTVVYLTHGVGTVKGRESRQVGDRDREFVVVELPTRGMTVAVPMEEGEGVGLRPVMSAADADGVVEVLRAAPERLGSTWSQRVAKCQARLKSGDPLQAAACVRDLAALDRSGRISYNEASVLGNARSNLVEELAVTWGESRTAVERRVDDALGGVHAEAA
jgi:CarD family transcriptional regulator